MMGLKQSGRVWHGHFRQSLLEMGFTQCESAPCLYTIVHTDGVILVGLDVDDLLLLNFSSDCNALDDLVNTKLNLRFRITCQPNLEKFLGAELELKTEGIYMHLQHYIHLIVDRFDERSSAPSPVPAIPAADIPSSAADEALLLRADKLTYQAITGAVMFCMTTCRPDIAHATNMLARRMSQPRRRDMLAARRLLRYLRTTSDFGLLFPYARHHQHPGLHAFADSDWANDTIERRSTSGYIVLYNGTPISWHSGLQSVIALSSCEAEYVSLCDCCRELAYLRQLLAFLHDVQPEPTPVYEDNQGAIDLVHNRVNHRRTKHVDVKYHFIRRCETERVVQVLKVHTLENRADIFTKVVTGSLFATHVRALMHCPSG